MKSSVPLALAGILSCILVGGCVQTPQASAPNPPATSYQVGLFELGDGGSSQKVRGASVTAAFFQSVKVMPLLGRSFLPGEYSSSSNQVLMVSWRFWQQQFGGAPRIIGTTMHLNGQTFTVIGIMPTMFDVPSGVDIWIPKAG
jgi:putative ABC transport system permease protein